MMAGLASGVYDRISLLRAKMASGKKGREGLNVVHISEGTSPPLMTRLKSPEVGPILSLGLPA
jgi:hypothetical protein